MRKLFKSRLSKKMVAAVAIKRFELYFKNCVSIFSIVSIYRKKTARMLLRSRRQPSRLWKWREKNCWWPAQREPRPPTRSPNWRRSSEGHCYF